MLSFESSSLALNASASASAPPLLPVGDSSTVNAEKRVIPSDMWQRLSIGIPQLWFGSILYFYTLILTLFSVISEEWVVEGTFINNNSCLDCVSFGVYKGKDPYQTRMLAASVVVVGVGYLCCVCRFFTAFARYPVLKLVAMALLCVSVVLNFVAYYNYHHNYGVIVYPNPNLFFGTGYDFAQIGAIYGIISEVLLLWHEAREWRTRQEMSRKREEAQIHSASSLNGVQHIPHSPVGKQFAKQNESFQVMPRLSIASDSISTRLRLLIQDIMDRLGLVLHLDRTLDVVRLKFALKDQLSHVQKRLVFSANIFFTLLYFGGFIIIHCEDGWALQDGINYVLAAWCTLGYGLYTPVSTSGRVFMYFYWPIGFAIISSTSATLWRVFLFRCDRMLRRASAKVSVLYRRDEASQRLAITDSPPFGIGYIINRNISDEHSISRGRTLEEIFSPLNETDIPQAKNRELSVKNKYLPHHRHIYQSQTFSERNQPKLAIIHARHHSVSGTSSSFQVSEPKKLVKQQPSQVQNLQFVAQQPHIFHSGNLVDDAGTLPNADTNSVASALRFQQQGNDEHCEKQQMQHQGDDASLFSLRTPSNTAKETSSLPQVDSVSCDEQRVTLQHAKEDTDNAHETHRGTNVERAIDAIAEHKEEVKQVSDGKKNGAASSLVSSELAQSPHVQAQDLYIDVVSPSIPVPSSHTVPHRTELLFLNLAIAIICVIMWTCISGAVLFWSEGYVYNYWDCQWSSFNLLTTISVGSLATPFSTATSAWLVWYLLLGIGALAYCFALIVRIVFITSEDGTRRLRQRGNRNSDKVKTGSPVPTLSDNHSKKPLLAPADVNTAQVKKTEDDFLSYAKELDHFILRFLNQDHSNGSTVLTDVMVAGGHFQRKGGYNVDVMLPAEGISLLLRYHGALERFEADRLEKESKRRERREKRRTHLIGGIGSKGTTLPLVEEENGHITSDGAVAASPSSPVLAQYSNLQDQRGQVSDNASENSLSDSDSDTGFEDLLGDTLFDWSNTIMWKDLAVKEPSGR